MAVKIPVITKDGFEADDNVHVIVLTGSEKAFAAGADIKEMADKTHIDAFLNNFGANEDAIARARKPVVAAVAGFGTALATGSEWAALGAGGVVGAAVAAGFAVICVIIAAA